MQLKNKILKIVLSCLAVIPLLLPFQMYADTVLTSDNVVGINVYTTPISEESFIQDNREYYKSTAIVNVEFELDQSYLGWINLGFVIKYKGHNLSSGWTDYTKTWSGNYYVNGSVIHIEVPISWNSVLSGYYMGSGHLPASSSDLQNITYSNQGSITPIGDLSTLQDILDVLNDIKQNVEIDVLGELQNIVTDIGIANEYLEAISKYRQWNIPFESFGAQLFLLSRVDRVTGYDIYDFLNNSYTEYPIYSVDAGNQFVNANVHYNPANANNSMIYIFGIRDNPINASNISTKLHLDPNLTIVECKYLKSIYIYSAGYGSDFSFYKLIVRNDTSSHINMKMYSDLNSVIVPIYLSPYNVEYLDISTDFALQWGLSNRLLDDLSIISEGTESSNNSSNNLESQNTQFSTDSNNLMNLEDTLGNQMNDNLEQIDTNFDVGNQFGSKFLASAEWVRNQYNTLTSNTPFGTFISFSLLIGLALLLMGRLL